MPTRRNKVTLHRREKVQGKLIITRFDIPMNKRGPGMLIATTEPVEELMGMRQSITFHEQGHQVIAKGRVRLQASIAEMKVSCPCALSVFGSSALLQQVHAVLHRPHSLDHGSCHLSALSTVRAPQAEELALSSHGNQHRALHNYDSHGDDNDDDDYDNDHFVDEQEDSLDLFVDLGGMNCI
ncbi:hypothetical protein L7F22_037751 [Adiantum nelumboides]|nr:hypothetical protein [Adiantum nelumboides]